MSRRCFKNCNKEGEVHSPCLKEEKHVGKCEHESLCREPCCMCGSLELALEANGLLDEYNKLLSDNRILGDKIRALREAVSS